MNRFIHWHYVLVIILTLVFGAITIVIAQKLNQTTTVAPTVPQKRPEAVTPACTLTFSIDSPTYPLQIGSPSSATTPLPTVNLNPDCTSLSVNPSFSLSAPLVTTLTCSGLDGDGNIAAGEFIFGDGKTQSIEKNVGSPGTISTTYTYIQPGNYYLTCRVRDNRGAFSNIPDSCKKTVTIGEK